MVKEDFLEFNDDNGIGDLLFVNISQPNLYKFFRRRKTWDECYMVEFRSDSDEFTLYWGHNVNERSLIDATEVLLPSHTKDKWKKIDFNHFSPFNLTQIVESIEKTISEKG